MHSILPSLPRPRGRRLIDSRPAGPGSWARGAARAAALLVAASLALPARAAAQNCSPSYRDVSHAIAAQVWELGFGRAQDYWAARLQEGMTVKQVVYHQMHNSEYTRRFISGQDSSTVVAFMIQHLLAREPADADGSWIGVARTSGWAAVIDGILASSEYNTRFGDHVVPGSPVVSWDCARATGMFEAHHNSVRDVTQGAANLGYTSPAYVSLDQPRSLSLLYSTGLVSPTGYVGVNVVDNTATPPDRASIRLQVNGAWVTDEIFFQAGPGATRLSASFDARGYPSQSLRVNAVVRKYASNGSVQEQTVPTRAVIVSQRAAELGMGWVVAGLQRLRDQGDGVFITESGTGAWFVHLGTDADGSRRYASPAGDFTRVRWDAASGAYWRDYPDGTRVRFAASGQMIDVADRFGNRTSYRYTGEYLLGVTDPVGKEIKLWYSATGPLVAIEDPAGREVGVDPHGSTLRRFREPGGAVALDADFSQDASGGWILERWWTPGGDRNVGVHTGWTAAYDAHGKLASVTAPQVTTTDAGTTRPVHRFRSLESAVLAPAGTGSAAAPAPRVQPHEVRVEATDARGHTSKLAVDPFGAPTRIEEPLGRVRNIYRDRHGRVMRTEAPSGHWVAYTFVGVELRKVVDMNGMGMDIEYEPVFHQPTHIWGKGTTEVWNTYDTTHVERKLLSTRSGTAGAPETRFTYTTRGRVESVVDAEGHGTFYSYVDLAGGTGSGNLYQASAGTASGTYRRTTTLEHDGYGRTISVSGPGGQVSRTVYDLVNRVTSTISPEQDTTRYEHRPTGLYRVTDAKGQSYTFNRNLLGWVESEVDPRSQYTFYGYDRAGNATSMTNRRNQSITSGYDALGRMTTRTADGQQTTWSYDPADRWMEARNNESINRIEYDVAGRATREVTTMGGVTYTRVPAYDGEGRRTQMDVYGPWAGARGIGYAYDARGQLDSLRNFAGAVTTLGYNADGQEEWRAYPSGMVMWRNYISTHAPAEVSFSPGALNDRLGTNYRYGANGLVSDRLTKYNELYDSGTLARRYEYDKRGWLTSAYDEKIPAGSTTCDGTQDIDPDTGVTCTEPGQWEIVSSANWSYDRAGNRINASAMVETGNRLMSVDGWQFTYDADGNLTRKLKPGVDDLVLSWNGLGQMTQAWRYQKGTVTYGYDAFGRRVRRSAPDGTVIRYLYDGDDLLMELDGAGNPVREYTYLPGVDRPHSVRISQTGATYYFATDHPGNVIALIDGANQVVNQYRYGPWGEPEMVTEGVQQPLGYTAREWDSVAGLYQARARWYDPQTGRFVSEDPIGLAGGMNVYAYAANSPVNFTDPLGLCPQKPDPNHVVRAAAVEACAILLEAIPSGGSFEPDYGRHGGYTPEYLGGGGRIFAAAGGGAVPATSRTQSPNYRASCSWSKLASNAWDGMLGGGFTGGLYGAGVGAVYGSGFGTVAGGVAGAAIGVPSGPGAVVTSVMGSWVGGAAFGAIGATIGGIAGMVQGGVYGATAAAVGTLALCALDH